MDVTSEVPPAAPHPIAALQTVRRNASIKRLLKLPMWGSGKYAPRSKFYCCFFFPFFVFFFFFMRFSHFYFHRKLNNMFIIRFVELNRMESLSNKNESYMSNNKFHMSTHIHKHTKRGNDKYT